MSGASAGEATSVWRKTRRHQTARDGVGADGGSGTSRKRGVPVLLTTIGDVVVVAGVAAVVVIEKTDGESCNYVHGGMIYDEKTCVLLKIKWSYDGMVAVVDLLHWW